MRKIESSELIINGDGSIFHLHLRPEQLADRVILVGDPGRVERVSRYFDREECRAANREFVSVTGEYRGVRLTVVSTGIGTDNIDIVLTELDALANIDFATRTEKPTRRKLYLLRLGTSGTVQPEIELGRCILSRYSIGLDGLLNFYAGRDAVCDLELERRFREHMVWNPQWTAPYVVRSSDFLCELLADFTVSGMTVSAPGFYGPQGRWVRLQPSDPELISKLASFTSAPYRITNLEMESSALAGLARLFGHEATTVCVAIAQRNAKQSNTDYSPYMETLIRESLDRLVRF